MYIKKPTQEQKILDVLLQGKKIAQIDLQRYWALVNKKSYKSDIVDATIDLNILNLPARIFGLKKKGYNIISEDIKTKNAHYVVYRLATGLFINGKEVKEWG